MKYANSNINYKKTMEIKKTIVGNSKEAFANKSALKEVKITDEPFEEINEACSCGNKERCCTSF